MQSESKIIETLQAAFATAPDVTGIGDDAAIFPLNAEESYVISKDILVENRHFRLSYGDIASLAHKALHVNLSDIAAMGATPLFVMLGIALPAKLAGNWTAQFLAAFTAACKERNVHLIGGDTTASERDLFLSITVIGRAEKTHLKLRSTAKSGNVIAVAGNLGEAHAGLTALEKNLAGLETVKAHSLRPDARNAEGIWLGAQPAVTAMMDISDGLYVDLTRLLQASQQGGTITLETLLPSPQLADACKKAHLDIRECMLTGGEDYALLLTVDAAAFPALAASFKKQFNYSLVKIGEVTTGDELQLCEAGQPVSFTYRPFSHFGEL